MNNNQPNLMAKLISRKQKQNQSIKTAEDNKNVGAIDDDDKKNCKLLKIHQIPSHLRFNKYVLTHYRPTTNFMGCLKSLFYVHNETVNILTHGKYLFRSAVCLHIYRLDIGLSQHCHNNNIEGHDNIVATI